MAVELNIASDQQLLKCQQFASADLAAMSYHGRWQPIAIAHGHEEPIGILN
jgi:hypothetical protein